MRQARLVRGRRYDEASSKSNETKVDIKNNRTAILLLTHLQEKSIVAQFSKILRDCTGHFDVFLLCDNTSRKFDRYRGDTRFFLFDASQLAELGYPGKSTIENLHGPLQSDRHHQRFNFDPGNVELPLLRFFKDYPGYDHYWTVEYDVRFTGSWDAFFSSFAASSADLLGTTLTRYDRAPDWHHWPSLDLAGRPIGKERYLRGFFPIYRLSRRALAQLDSDYRTGVKGHFECLVPTLLNHAGMSVEDIGGNGEFVRPGNRNRFYRNTPSHGSLNPGTFVFRPAMDRPGDEPDMLWHPVRHGPLWRTALRRMKQTLLQPLRRVHGHGGIATAGGMTPLEPRVENPASDNHPN